MSPQIRATKIVEAAEGDDVIALDYEARFLRRKRLVSTAGRAFLVDLPETVSLKAGDAFLLEDGSRIAVAAAPEALYRVTGDLVRLAWHIGNRHTPCQIAEDHLLIRQDVVLRRMIEGLGGMVEPTDGAFAPEGGAYGLGRTLAHDHGHTHDHG